jgi:branched-chain amino acid transport system ATP-binding protein
MLEVRDLSCGYGRNIVLQNVSFRVGEREIVAIIGSNGAGKTTTLRTISGLIKPVSGKIHFCGNPIDGMDPSEISRQRLIHVPEGRGIFPELSVLENLLMGAITVRDKIRRKENFELVYHLFPILESRLSQYGGTLSGGEQQMLAFGRALMAEPRLLMLDEPSMGLSPLLVGKIFDSIMEINRKEIPILLVEQNAYATLEVSHRAYVIENGHIVMEGISNDLMEDDRVKRAYLGLETEA